MAAEASCSPATWSQVEREMLDTNELQHADVLKVAHHGIRTSSTEEFLSAVTPAFAVISDGFENSYGHPHPAVIERLQQHHADILRTDQQGLITIRTEGRCLSVETYRQRTPLVPELAF